MSSVRRIYVEKKPAYAVAAKDLFENIRDYLGIRTVTGVRVLIRYDIENISDKTYEEARLRFFQSLRLMYYMKKHFRCRKEKLLFLLRHCLDSLIREPILLNSASSF